MGGQRVRQRGDRGLARGCGEQGAVGGRGCEGERVTLRAGGVALPLLMLTIC